MNGSLLGSSVHGVLLARTPEWVAIPFSRGSSPPRGWTLVSHIEGRFFTVWATMEAWADPTLPPKIFLPQIIIMLKLRYPGVDSTERHKNMYPKWLYQWELMHIQHSELWKFTCNIYQLFCCCLIVKSCPILFQPHELYSTRPHCTWDFPGKNMELDCHFLLQGMVTVFITEPHEYDNNRRVCVCVLATQLCSALCDLMEGSLSGFSVHGIFQARIPEWTAIHFSRGSSPPRNWTLVSCIYHLSYQGRSTKVAVSDSLSESKNRISHLWQKQNETSTYPFRLFIGKVG